MAKCIIFGGTRVCSGSPNYRVNNGRKRKFPRLSPAARRRSKPVRDAINALNVPDPQQKLAIALLDRVLAATWTNTKTANSKDIRESVELFLLNAVGDLRGDFTLIAY